MQRANRLLVLSLALLLGLTAGLAAQEESGDSTEQETEQSQQQNSAERSENQQSNLPTWARERQYQRVGVAIFENLSDVDDGAKEISRSIYQKLKNRAGKVEFVKVDRSDPSAHMGPSEARDLGARYDVDAIIWGSLIEIRIPSGSFPSRTNRRPMARAKAVFNATETTDGEQLVSHLLVDQGMKHYSWSVGNEEELYSEVIHRLGNICWNVMKDEALFNGVEPNIKKRNERRKEQRKLKDQLSSDEDEQDFSISPF